MIIFLLRKQKKQLNNAENLFLEIDLNDPNEMVFCKAAMGSEPLDPKQLTAQNAKMLS
jgi:hypothetical protein